MKKSKKQDFNGTREGAIELDDLAVRIWYKNHRGVERSRKIRPISFEFRATKWHSEPQWILMAMDLEKNQIRYFAMKDIHEWRKLNADWRGEQCACE